MHIIEMSVYIDSRLIRPNTNCRLKFKGNVKTNQHDIETWNKNKIHHLAIRPPTVYNYSTSLISVVSQVYFNICWCCLSTDDGLSQKNLF